MKKRINGQRVQNWHRPLHKNDLSQRFLRIKCNPEALEQFSDDCWMDNFDPDWYSNPCTIDEIRQQFLNIIPTRTARQLQELIPDDIRKRLTEISIKPEITPKTVENPRKINKKVAEWFRKNENRTGEFPPLAAAKSGMDFAKNSPHASILNDFIASPHRPISITATYLLLHRGLWIRRIGTWQKPDSSLKNQLKSLLKHLFVKFPVPECLLEPVNNEPNTLYPDQFKWLAILGRGGRIKSARKIFQWNCSQKLQHFLFQTPPKSTFQQSLQYAEVLRLGGTEKEWAAVSDSTLRAYNPLKPYDNPQITPQFFKECVQWLAQQPPRLTEGQDILDWAHDQFTRSRNQLGMQPFSLTGRSIYNVNEAVDAYNHERIMRRFGLTPKSYIPWPSKEMEFETLDENGAKWTISELKTHYELCLEGAKMRSCVATFASKCSENQSAIFTLKREGVPKLTIEWGIAQQETLQVKGKCNRAPRSAELKIVNEWAAIHRNA